jgi:transposase
MFFENDKAKIFVFREPIDMRAGFERLHGFCLSVMRAKMDQGHVYLFFGKNRRRMKLLFYDGTGLVLVAKRLERSQFMSHAELLGRTEVSRDELRELFRGSVLRRPIFEREEKTEEKEILSTQREELALAAGSMNFRFNHESFRPRP